MIGKQDYKELCEAVEEHEDYLEEAMSYNYSWRNDDYSSGGFNALSEALNSFKELADLIRGLEVDSK